MNLENAMILASDLYLDTYPNGHYIFVLGEGFPVGNDESCKKLAEEVISAIKTLEKYIIKETNYSNE